MREDLHKIIVERARPGSRARPTKKWDPLKKLKGEDAPSKESMKIRHGDNRRQFNENLAPLRRWLERQVGRPWDKVYSEACQVIKPNSTVKAHVKTHLLEMVELHAKIIDGIPCHIRFRAGYEEIFDNDFYVDPVTKLLRQHRKLFVKRRPQPEVARLIEEKVMPPRVSCLGPEPGSVWIPDGISGVGHIQDIRKGQTCVWRHIYRQIKGLWFEVEEYEIYTWVRSGLLAYDPKHHKLLKRRQLNKKELTALGFVNKK